jgi:hypothetical protein
MCIFSHPGHLCRLSDQFESDPFVPEARTIFTERAAEAVESQDPLVRDSRTNPKVLQYRLDQALVSNVPS